MRLIPGKTKVQVELFKGVTLLDVLIGLIAVLLLVEFATDISPVLSPGLPSVKKRMYCSLANDSVVFRSS